MDIEITLKNYRCFSDDNPARFIVRNGFIAFIGVNNAGKSSLLKFFVELRNLFYHLSQQSSVNAAIIGKPKLDGLLFVEDSNGIWCNRNNRNIEIEFSFQGVQPRSTTSEPINLDRAIVTIYRGSHNWDLQVFGEEREINIQSGNTKLDGWKLRNQGVQIDLSLLTSLGQLFRTMYLGPFRNAINLGSSDKYYDIKVGEAFIRTWNEHKTGASKADNEAIIHLTEDIKRIFGFNS